MTTKDKGGLGAGKNALFRIKPDKPADPPTESESTPDVETPAADNTVPDSEARSRTGRKRRKDYQGGKRKDYHRDSTMLGVRVPNDVADEIRSRAAVTDQSVNAWLLAVVLAALEDDDPA